MDLLWKKFVAQHMYKLWKQLIKKGDFRAEQPRILS